VVKRREISEVRLIHRSRVGASDIRGTRNKIYSNVFVIIEKLMEENREG
jgi:hypothetical protein